MTAFSAVSSRISDPPDDVPGAVWLDVDGSRMFGVWRRPPQPGRPVLVFLHDGLGSVGTLRKFPAETGAAMDLPAFAYDRLGYGRSDRVEAFPADFMGGAAGSNGCWRRRGSRIAVWSGIPTAARWRCCTARATAAGCGRS